MSESWIELAAKECAAEVLVGAGEQTFARIIKSRFKGPTPRPWLRAEEVTEEGWYWLRGAINTTREMQAVLVLRAADGRFFISSWGGFVDNYVGLWQRIPEPELPKEEA